MIKKLLLVVCFVFCCAPSFAGRVDYEAMQQYKALQRQAEEAQWRAWYSNPYRNMGFFKKTFKQMHDAFVLARKEERLKKLSLLQMQNDLKHNAYMDTYEDEIELLKREIEDIDKPVGAAADNWAWSTSYFLSKTIHPKNQFDMFIGFIQFVCRLLILIGGPLLLIELFFMGKKIVCAGRKKYTEIQKEKEKTDGIECVGREIEKEMRQKYILLSVYFDDLFSWFYKEIKNSFDTIANVSRKKNVPQIAVLYAVLFMQATEQLKFGEWYVHRGMLNMQGEDMYALWKYLLEKLEQYKYFPAEDFAQRRKEMAEWIKTNG